MTSQRILKSTLALLMLSLIAAQAALASPITVTTDKPTYAAGETVIISGTSAAGATVTVQVKNPLGTTIFTDVVTATAGGVFTTTFRLPSDAITGSYTVYASAPEGTASTAFTVTAAVVAAVVRLGVTIETGAAYFPGETATIYVLTDGGDGKPTDTDVTASIILPDGTIQALTLARVATGLYKTTYVVPSATGTYLVKAEASKATLYGSSIKGLLVSPALVENVVGLKTRLAAINATIVDIKEGVATIRTDVGTLKTNLAAINATIVGIKGDVVAVKTTLGTITTTLSDIGAKIIAIQGPVATILTDVGTIKTTVGAIKTTTDTISAGVTDLKGTVGGLSAGIYAAAAFAIIAAIAAIVAVIQIYKKVYLK